MQFPLDLDYAITGLPDATSDDAPVLQHKIKISGGRTTLVGPNGSGKTQILRSIKTALSALLDKDRVRFVSAGRLAHLENFRSDYDGQRGANLRYGQAAWGGRDNRDRRHKIETALGDFQTLSARADILIKVSERLKTFCASGSLQVIPQEWM